MNQYHKIMNVYKRNNDTNRLLVDEYATPEFEYLADCQWEWTEKVDGTNIRIMWEDGELRIGGRTDRANIPAHLLQQLMVMFTKEKMVSAFKGDSVCLYGEGYGPKIQKVGGLYGDKPSFVLFDVRVGHWWLKRECVVGIGHILGIDSVPVIGFGTIGEAIELVRSGLQSRWGDFEAEGIVARPAVPLLCRSGERIITKIKAKEFK